MREGGKEGARAHESLRLLLHVRVTKYAESANFLNI